MSAPDDNLPEGDHDGEPSYRRTHDHLVEPFFAGLHRDTGDAAPVEEEAAPARRGTLHIVRTWIRVVFVRVRTRD